MGRLAPVDPPPVTEFVPPATITFLGGPRCGQTIRNEDEERAIDFAWPEWVQTHGEDHLYYRLDPDDPPGWITNVPHVDQFDKVFVWCGVMWQTCPCR